MSRPKLIWDIGTGYDFFLSLEVLHKPLLFGVRPAWTAGMRARAPVRHREILEVSQLLFHAPSYWVQSLPQPKDAATVLWHLGQIEPAQRLKKMASAHEKKNKPLMDMIQEVIESGKWSEPEKKLLCNYRRQGCGWEPKYTHKEAELVLQWYTRSEEFGERILEALKAYYEVFFAEEERRILPAIKQTVQIAKRKAEELPFDAFIEYLTQGVSISHFHQEINELVLAPSFWSAPLIKNFAISDHRELLVFGARPKHMSLVPGEKVPDMLIRSLKTLSDPTRLRILQHLSASCMTPAQLSRSLRLRPPTITHHLKALRLAGLIRVKKDHNFEANYYAARSDALTSLYERLDAFLKGTVQIQDPGDGAHHH
ncbi:MAG: winged helix-turn-helix transcriptional regulator [Desulfobacteraceae bacterium]|nr:winged helix-turn-helix transcriptional regulator [Desulfobacteraceae bacterium]